MSNDLPSLSSHLNLSASFNSNQGNLFILSAPAGSGKTTLVSMLQQEFSQVKTSISYTTRAPRLGEVHGQHYFFISKPEFEAKLKQGAFIESVYLFGNYYGTTQESIAAQMQPGIQLFLVIDTQGALHLKEKMKACLIFLSPPSLMELKRRLEMRRSESAEKIAERLALAQKEMTFIDNYDYHIVNDHLPTAYTALKSIVIAQAHRVR